MQKEWKVLKSSEGKSFVERLLSTRGIVDKCEVEEFLNPNSINILPPTVFTAMETAVEMLSNAIAKGECILVYGDFDSDGVTSTALLIRTLNFLGAKVEYYIPDREKEGHGLNTKALVKLMAKKKPKVIVTVDCGVSDTEQVKFINSFKIDVIITDHHEAPEILPDSLAIINPKAQNSLSDKLTAQQINNLCALAGVGVAFKLACGLLIYFEKTEFISELLPYVAVGTIADIVPLIGENRYFVTKGLNLISKGKHYGLQKLLESAGYSLENGISAENIAFGVAPRINASGRLDSVDNALKVLISDNKQEIELAILTLNDLNKVRQELCENTFLEADEMLQKEGNTENAIILFNPKWLVGIVGIVASKLVEKYYKPTFLMTYSEETKQIRCSSRGIEGLNIYDILSDNADLFDGYGGHSMAGGLSFSKEKVSFEEVKKALNETIDGFLNSQKLTPVLNIDLNLQPSEVGGNLISDIERLQPFGASNQTPVFAMHNLKLVQKTLMGANKNHLKLMVEDSQNNIFTCIWWSKGDISLTQGDILDIAFCPQLNTYNGETTLQLILQDIHADNLKEESSDNDLSVKFYDHRKKSGVRSSVEDYVKASNLNIGIFAEEQSIINILKPYKALTERLFNRRTVSPKDSIMFFDYPSSRELLDEIMEKSSPKFVHLMNCEIQQTNEKEILKMSLGMLRYAYNNLNGDFDLQRSASFLAQPVDTILDLLDIFEQSETIKIQERNQTHYKIEFLTNSDISKALHTKAYKEFKEDIKETENYKKSFFEAELSEFYN